MPQNQEIFCPLFQEKGIQVFVKRLDKVGENISGNKWYKLLPNIKEARAQKKEAIITFGGAFSNHIFATAAAGKKFEIPTIGYIRGDAQLELNPTLKFALECGMDIRYLSRTDYRLKENKNFLQDLLKEEENYFLIPEGGSNNLGIKGCEGILEGQDFDFAIMACGTGGSFSGMVGGSFETVCLGIPVLKGANFLFETIKQNLNRLFGPEQKNWDLFLDYHFGGYGKIKPELLNFIQQFYEDHQILLEPIYTGKMMYALFDLIKKNHFPEGAKIIAIHTGGIQGWNGIENRYKISRPS